MKKVNKIGILALTKVKPALLFSFAFLLLAISCPVKQLIQNQNFKDAPTASKKMFSNNKQRKELAISYSNLCNISLENTNKFSFNGTQKVELPSPLWVTDFIHTKGFSIHYSLNAVNIRSYYYSSTYYSTPRYIQQLRLLI